MVIDHTKYGTIMNEYKTVANDQLPYIHIVQWAPPMGAKVWPFRTLIVVGTFVLSLFLSILIVNLLAIFKKFSAA
ncbi:MAG: hypothetical protein R2831_10360 [Chitinophagaceae bacterium]